MKRILLPLTFFSLLTVASADALRDQMKIMGSGVSKAMMNKDIATVDKILRPMVVANFTYSEPEMKGAKPMTYDQMISTMKQGMDMMTQITLADVHLLNVKKQGDTSVATSVHKMLGFMPGTGTKKRHSISYTGISTEVWQLQGGKWKMLSMSMRTGEMKMDGKLVPPSKM